MRMLCYGDSNTYGYDPRSFFGDRYPPESRWVDLLAAKSGWECINCGENGRQIPRYGYELEELRWFLQRNAPVDMLVMLLGYNDLMQGMGPDGTAARMEAALDKIKDFGCKVMLVAPPAIRRGTWVPNDKCIADSKLLPPHYEALARKIGGGFADGTQWDIGMSYDGVHFTEAGHKVFAEELYKALKEYLGTKV